MLNNSQLLPNGWSVTTLGDITEKPEKVFPKDLFDTTFKYLDISSVDNIKNVFSSEKITKVSEAPSRARQLVLADDVLFSTVRPYLKNIGIVPKHLDRQIASTGFCVLRAKPSIEPRYLLYLSISLAFIRALEPLQRGSSYPAVRDKDVRGLTVPLPPSEEQRRIVAKIEQLFSELDKGVESLKAARAQLKTYRQALLKAAFEGRLTEQWRQKNADKLETADNLIPRIRREREAHYRKQLEDWEGAMAEWEAAGKPGKKPRKPKPIREGRVGGSDINRTLPVLPDEWKWISAEGLVDSTPYSLGIGPFGSNLKVSDYTESGVPLVFVRNITRNDFNKEGNYISKKKAEELYAHQALPGDILITKMGDPPGDAAIYPKERPVGVITADCLKFRINSAFFDRKFVCYFINSFFAKAQLGVITRGVAQKKISVERFKSIVFPVLSLEEQERIVATLEVKLSQVESLENIVEDAIERSEALRQSTLKRAFSGKLVAQDRNEEPAGDLLDRIRQEQPDTPKPKRRKRKTGVAA